MYRITGRKAGVASSLGRGLRLWLLLSLGLLIIPNATAWAQVTSASLRGTVLDEAGSPVGDAQVVLEFPASQMKKESITSSNGQFAFTGLRIGGPYTIKAVKSGMQEVKRDGIQLNSGNNDAIVLNLGKVEVMSIVGTREARTSQKTSFFASDIDHTPVPSQDLRDVVKQAPDAIMDNGRLSVGGSNNRFNSITIDGIRQDDSFGLNGSGYPTQRSPVSLMSVEEISLEKSPFDVRYGNFLGGNINVVTKSGTNEFQGGVMITHGSDKLSGKKSKHQKYSSNFEENRIGLSLGGPIIEDKLHFFANVEGLTQTRPSTAGPKGSGKPFQVERVSTTDVARVQEIAGRVYGFDAGTASKTLKEEDMKYLLKLDYRMSDNHRLEAKYQHSEGNNISDQSASNTLLPLTSNWYDKREKMNTGSLRLFSDWSDALSTKVEVSTKQVRTEQLPLNGNDFMTAEVKNSASTSAADIAQAGTTLVGPDRSRHANELRNTSNTFGAEANYLVDRHLVTGGVQVEQVDVFNLFVQDANGRAFYDTIAAFEARTPSRLNYQNAISNNKDDAAANWGYGVNTLYLQDEWQVTPALTARAGLRGEFYDANGPIDRNEFFIQRYGYSNTSSLSGRQAVLPRLGLSYKASSKLNLRGGFGLFSGGTPNVWVSNVYTNDGVSVDDVSSANAAEINGFDGRNIPASMQSQLVAGDGNVDVLDPDFKIPQSYKFQTGLDYRFDIPSFVDNIGLELNYSYTKTRYGVTWKDLRYNNPTIGGAANLPKAYAPDGRAIYDTTPGSTTAGEFNVNRGYDLLLTNTDKGYGHNASASLSKEFNTGWNVRSSYAWQDVQEVSPAGNSTSSSNYSLIPVKYDPNDIKANRSVYERKHRILLSVGYQKSFFENLMSSVDVLYERRSGQPYSFTMGGDRNALGRMYGESSAFSGANRELFYVPKGDGSDVILETDPAKGAINQAAFDAFIKKYGLDKYRGQIAPRNAFFSDWVQEVSMRLGQELPGYGDGKARIVLDILNVPNLMNKKWGQIKQVGYPYMPTVSNVSYDAASNRYIYSNLRTTDPDSVRLSESVWKMQLAAYYNF